MVLNGLLMLRDGFQYYVWHFWKFPNFDQIWNFGHLIYCRNTFKNTRKFQTHFKSCKSKNIESWKCWKLRVAIFWNFRIRTYGCFKFWNLKFGSFEISKFWNFWTFKFLNRFLRFGKRRAPKKWRSVWFVWKSWIWGQYLPQNMEWKLGNKKKKPRNEEYIIE